MYKFSDLEKELLQEARESSISVLLNTETDERNFVEFVTNFALAVIFDKSIQEALLEPQFTISEK